MHTQQMTYLELPVVLSSFNARNTTHVFDMSLNKYACHIANISHTAIMLNGHINPTF